MSQPCAQDRAFARRISRGFKTGGGRHRSDSRRARIDATYDVEWWLDGADIHQIVANAAADGWRVIHCGSPAANPHGVKRPSP